MKILYKSADVRREIIRLFSSAKGRRVAIVGFVGQGAQAFLPKPQGLHLICWPKPGGTNPYALKRLIKNDIKVSFADSLHMKVYWTEDKGSIITSANLSTNALGSGNLQEVGVLLDKGTVDIDRIVKTLDVRDATSTEIDKLSRLHDALAAKNTYRKDRQSKATTYRAWYQSQNPKWKLGWWEDPVEASWAAKKVVKEKYQTTKIHDWINCAKGQFEQGDWVLTFRIKRDYPTRFAWMFIDYVVRVSSSDKKAYEREYPYQTIQVWTRSHYKQPPFPLSNRFQVAFSKAISEYGINRIRNLKSLTSSPRLLKLIQENYPPA